VCKCWTLPGVFLRGVFLRPWKSSISEAYGDHAYEAGAHNIELIVCYVLASFVTIPLSLQLINWVLENAKCLLTST
jgi:hypothetical protein